MAIDHNHLDLHASHLWADYQNNALPSGTVAYENALRQCQLDGSLESLQRIDALLTRLRQELIKKFTQTQTGVNTVDMQRKLLADERFVSLLLIIGHYAGNVLAQQWQYTPTWYGRHKLVTQVNFASLGNQEALAKNWVHALVVQYGNETDDRLQQTTVANIKRPAIFFVLEPIINRLFGSFDNVVRSVQTDERVANGLSQAVQQRLPNASSSVAKSVSLTPKRQSSDTKAPLSTVTTQTTVNTTHAASSSQQPQPSLTDRLQAQTAHIETRLPVNPEINFQTNSLQPKPSQANPAKTHVAQLVKTAPDKQSIVSPAAVSSTTVEQASIEPIAPAASEVSKPKPITPTAVQTASPAKVGVSSIKSIAASHGIFAELMQDIMTLPVQQNVGSDAYKKVSQFFVQLDKAYPKLDEADTTNIVNNLSDKQKNSLSKAKAMLRKLAEQGNTDAMLHLAVYLMQGKWLDKNQQQGLTLIQTAANAQDPRAMRMMSKLYYQGLGVDADVSMGRHWLNLAADKGHEDAKNLIKQMDLAQMMIAERQEEIKSDNRLIKLMAAVAVVAVLIVMMF